MLYNCLSDFRTRVNENDGVKKLLKGWEPVIVVSSSDTGACFSLVIREKAVADLLPQKLEHNHQILVEGEEAMLEQIFSGSVNPAEAVLDGQMAVYGSDRDQLKLDALSLMIWGM